MQVLPNPFFRTIFFALMFTLIMSFMTLFMNGPLMASTPPQATQVLTQHPSNLETVTLQGTVVLWSKSVCPENATDQEKIECALPKPTGASWPVTVTYQRPKETGATFLTQQTLHAGNWQVNLMMIWVRPEQAPSNPYIITQLSLQEKVLGLIAECSRYDGVDDFDFLPPGSCSGRNGRKTYGVSILGPSPLASKQ